MDALDGLRGVSILLVLAAHVYTPGWIELGGRFGVTIFFVLSGFLITRLLLREERGSGRVDLTAFFIRRAFRLFPVYYVVLGFYILVLLGLRLQPDAAQSFRAALPWYLFYLQEIPYFDPHWPYPRMPFYQSWSLGIEEKFYLLWPFLSFRLLKSTGVRTLAASVGVLLCSVAPFLSPFGRYVEPYAAIFVGCALALVYDAWGLESRFTRAWEGLLVLGIWGAVHVTASHGPVVASRVAELLYPLAAALLLTAALSCPFLNQTLSVRPMTLLGRLSYSIYLTHLLARNALMMVLAKAGVASESGILVYALMLALSVAVGWILFTVLETPLRRLGRAIASGATHAAIEPPAEPR